MKNVFEQMIKPFLFGLLLITPPILLYFFIKWDPLIYQGDGEVIPLSIYLLTAIYLVVFFQIYKFRKRSKERAWQLAQFLSEKWTVEKREEERIKLTSNFLFMHALKDEYPEIFEDELLKLP
jgi:hypothetical protein